MRHRKGITVFLLITFGYTWAYMFVAALGLGWSLANPLPQLPIAFAPAVAAIIVRKWVTREGFADAGLKLRLRQAAPFYLAAWLVPLALAAATIALAAALGLWRPDLSALDGIIPGLPWWGFIAVLLPFVALLTPVYWGEEFGWTSYLRLRLLPERPILATVATGLIWAVWHYPLAFLGYAEYGNVTLGLALWTIGFLMQEVVLTWLRMRSGSIWPASLAHAGNNMTLSLLIILVLEERAGLDIMTTMALVLVPMGLLCAWIVAAGKLHEATAARVAGPVEPAARVDVSP